MRFVNKWLILGLAFASLFVIFLRFWQLGTVPLGLNIDEASYGYDAYSLLTTGKDQWGVRYPSVLKSFGDYKPAALSYLVSVLIPIFDLNTLVVRLPSAVSGVLILVVLYLTLKELVASRKLSIFLTIIFALSPWAFGISRLFYESNIGLLFYAIAVLLVVRTLLSKNLKNLPTIALLLALSGYFYEGLRFTSCLSILLLIAIFRQLKSLDLKKVFIFCLVYFVVSLPLLIPTIVGGLTRIKQEGGIQNSGNAMFIDENRSMCYLSTGKNLRFGKFCSLLWNKPAERVAHIAKSLVFQTSPVYLFEQSAQEDIVPRDYGPYLWILAPMYLLGLVFLFCQLAKNKSSNKLEIFLLASYIIGCLPGALATTPMIHRNVVGLYICFFIIALGFNATYLYLSKIMRGQLYLGVYSLLIVYYSIQFLVFYFCVYVNMQPAIWRRDSQEIFAYVKNNQKRYHKIFFQGFENAPLYFAFYTKYNPLSLQSQIASSTFENRGWIHMNKLDKLISTSSSVEDLLCQRAKANSPQNYLFVGNEDPKYSKYAVIRTYSFRGDYQLHNIFDLDQLYESTKGIQNYKQICK